MTIDFSKLLPDPRDVQAPPGSINAELLALPQQREHTYDMVGRLVRLPRTGIIGVASQLHRGGDYTFIVVDGSACTKENGSEAYPRGGHHISVSDLEMQTAVEMHAVDVAFDVYALTAGETTAGIADARTRMLGLLEHLKALDEYDPQPIEVNFWDDRTTPHTFNPGLLQDLADANARESENWATPPTPKEQ